MSDTFFPRSKKAIGKTNAERVDEKHADSPAVNQTKEPDKGTDEAKRGWLGLDDDFGMELDRDAQVWKTYVKEADTMDKEMVEGRNNSLDVLLIFAALFSAISTAFIIESMKDLKPDYSESSAKTLFAMAKTLAAMSNGQPVDVGDLDPPVFTPTRSAVVVNMLWMLSLCMSVAVSLIAMLAKEWCYNFMTGRTGPIYDQARKRQQKWNGVLRWKMEEVMSCLPFVMHVALLLFAVGMCIYLWQINRDVAIPAIAITGLAGGIYGLTTTLPAVDSYCPYSTPMVPVAKSLVKLLLRIPYYTVYVLFNVVFEIVKLVLLPFQNSTIPDPLEHWRDRCLEIVDGWYDSIFGTQMVDVLLDNVTSQMLAWLITSCEDSRSVDVALQAIGAGGTVLPKGPLKEIDAKWMVADRLRHKGDRAEFWADAGAELTSACRYVRSLIVLNEETSVFKKYAVGMHTELMNRYSTSPLASDTPLIIAVSLFPSYSLARDSLPEDGRTAYDNALTRLITPALNAHIRTYGNKLDKARLCLLIEAVASCEIDRWVEQGERGDGGLMASLAVIWKRERGVVERTAAATLATFGQRIGARTWDERNIVRKALDAYRTNTADESTSRSLFAYGLTALLPWISVEHLDSESRSDFYGACWHAWQSQNYSLDFLDWPWEDYRTTSVARLLTSTKSALDGDHVATVLRAISPQTDTRLYIPALVALRHTRSRSLQEWCIIILSRQSAMTDPDVAWETFSDIVRNNEAIDVGRRGKQNEVEGEHQDPHAGANDGTRTPIYRALCGDLKHPNPRSICGSAFFFRLLLACTMLTTARPLEQRQATLRQLLCCPTDSNSYEVISGRSLPDIDRIISHVAEAVDGKRDRECMAQTMELVADFCAADPSTEQTSSNSEDEKLGEASEVDWMARLEKIKAALELPKSTRDPGRTTSEKEVEGTAPLPVAEPEQQTSAEPSVSAGPLTEVVVHNPDMN